MLKAAIFDLDGTLVNTEPLKAEAHAQTVAALGGSAQASLYRTVMGRSYEDVRAAFAAQAGLAEGRFDSKAYDGKFAELYRALRQSGVTYPEGIDDLLIELRWLGYKLAVVTSSDARTASEVLEQVGMTRLFHLTIAAEHVQRHKPAPDGMLMALQGLGVSARQAVAMEDSEAGVQAATAAKIPVIALRHELNAAHDFGSALAVLSAPIELASTLRLIEGAMQGPPSGGKSENEQEQGPGSGR